MAADTWPEIANDVISGRMEEGIKYDQCSKFEYPASNRFRVMFDLINTLQGWVSADRLADNIPSEEDSEATWSPSDMTLRRGLWLLTFFVPQNF